MDRKCIKNKEDLQTIERGLNMSELKLRPFEEQLANVIYTRNLKQAEENGREEGIEEGIKIGVKEGIKKGMEKIIKEKIEMEIRERIEKGMEKGIKKGREIGIEEGEKNIITKLLEKNTAEEISIQYNIPLEKIQNLE